MQRESIWEQYINSPNNERKKLQKDIRTDVLIIGGGIAGILCAYRLKKAGVSCIIVDKGNLLEGVTRNTTAKITLQHGLIYEKIHKTYHKEKAKQYYEINKTAIEEYKRLAESIPCDMEEKTAYIYTTNDRRKLETEAAVYEKLKIPYIWQEDTSIPIQTCGALGIKGQAQFNPIKFLQSLVNQLDYYENAEALDIEDKKTIIKTDKGREKVSKYFTITAEQIVLTTHFPMINIPGGYFAKMYQQRSYVTAIQNAPKLDGMYIDENEHGFSFRNYGDYLLLGGGGHKTGTKGGGYEVLRKFASQHYAGKKISYEWAAQDCMSLDKIPYIGIHSKNRSNLYVATGFNKWGMTSAMAAAIVLEEMIISGKSMYEQLFSPQRSFIHPQLAVNLTSALGNIIRPGKRCTHMGCALRWNPQERTWDCPCHGSRFREEGTVLENPAKRGL